MTRVIVLDTGTLGILTNPRQTPEVVACTAWLRDVLAAGVRMYGRHAWHHGRTRATQRQNAEAICVSYRNPTGW